MDRAVVETRSGPRVATEVRAASKGYVEPGARPPAAAPCAGGSTRMRAGPQGRPEKDASVEAVRLLLPAGGDAMYCRVPALGEPERRGPGGQCRESNRDGWPGAASLRVSAPRMCGQG